MTQFTQEKEIVDASYCASEGWFDNLKDFEHYSNTSKNTSWFDEESGYKLEFICTQNFRGKENVFKISQEADEKIFSVRKKNHTIEDSEYTLEIVELKKVYI